MGPAVHHEGDLVTTIDGTREACPTPKPKRNEGKDAAIRSLES